MNQEKFGKFIRELRKKNNLTQKQIAEKYNVSYQAVSKWENGLNMPDMSLIKQMSIDFNVSLDELLDGEYKKKNNKFKINKLIFILIFIILITIVSITLLLISKDDFQFKTLSSTCNNFNISGSIAYNEQKSAIYITDIEYCGKKIDKTFKEIECILFESNDNVDIKISSAKSTKENIKLEDFLKEVTLSIDNYEKNCDDYNNNSLYLSINAKDSDDVVTTYKIPLAMGSCST